MGQTQSTAHAEGCLVPFHGEQLAHLRARLAQLAEALSLVDAANGGGSADTPSFDTTTASFHLQPFEDVRVAGYQLVNDALLQRLSLAPDQPPCSALSLLSRNTALSVLDLSYNNLTAAIVQPLLDAIGELPVLTVLRLSGNPLGSASASSAKETAGLHQVPKGNNDELVLEMGEEEKAKEPRGSAQTPASQLGRWLATKPALQELALFQCGLNDYDVQALVRGLVNSPGHSSSPSSSSSSLTTLQLAGNWACTWRSAKLLLELVKSSGGNNTSLRVVELEGAPPATDVRFEYACTPDGHFRSGATLVAQADARGAPAAVSESDLNALTPGQSSRFRSRRRHLRDDLDGTRVMLPALMMELNAVLAARRAADGDAAVAHARNDAAATAAGAETPNTTDAKPEAMAIQDPDEATTSAAHASADEGNVAADAHTHRATASAASASPSATPPLFMTASHARATPQERRAARFEAPERLAHVMAEAYAFRRHVHPLQVDTHAPSCADIHARSTSSQYGNEAAASTWYAREGFVLRANGMARVLVAPVLSGAASARRNVLLEEVEDRTLQACWCTPRNSTNAANYAGSLHYHCVREGDPVRHSGGVTTRVRRTQRRTAATRATGTSLPPLSGAATAVSPVEEHARSGGRSYLACCGTGHTCLSASIVADGTQRSGRMRAALLTQSLPYTSAADLRPATSPGGPLMSFTAATSLPAAGRVGAVGRRGPRPHRGSSALSSTASDHLLAAPRATMFGGATTVHTTSNGVEVALNYSPVKFFAGPHVSCAVGIEVEECM